SSHALVWVDRDGKDEPLPIAIHSFSKPRLSPDGRQVAVVLDNRGVCANDLSRATLTPLTAADAQTNFPAWTPDGSRLAFVSNESGDNAVYVLPFSGARRKTRISSDGGQELAWAPDGRELFYRSGDRMIAVDIVT